MPKMHRNTLVAGLRPEPLGKLMRSPRLPSRNGACLLLRGERRGGLLVRGRREGGLLLRGWKGIRLKVKVSRINTDLICASML